MFEKADYFQMPEVNYCHMSELTNYCHMFEKVDYFQMSEEMNFCQMFVRKMEYMCQKAAPQGIRTTPNSQHSHIFENPCYKDPVGKRQDCQMFEKEQRGQLRRSLGEK